MPALASSMARRREPVPISSVVVTRKIDAVRSIPEGGGVGRLDEGEGMFRISPPVPEGEGRSAGRE
jgi:hypothetical protein